MLRVDGFEFRVSGLGFQVWGSGFRTSGLGERALVVQQRKHPLPHDGARPVYPKSTCFYAVDFRT